MKSETPEPADELKLVLQLKKDNNNDTLEVVSTASRWIKAQFLGSGVEFSYTPCDSNNPSAFSTFSVIKTNKSRKFALELKVAEINGKPFVFADILQLSQEHGRLFPYFADISSDDAKQNLLHYIADFLAIN